jgi:hypothetical protein
MYIVKKKDQYGSWVDVFHAQRGAIAFEFYDTLKKREGKDNVIILQQ